MTPPKASRVTAETLSRKQREISVSEFFAKNRHLLGFDSRRKALLTTVKEAVDNSLDACEESGVLPEIWVTLEATGEDFRYAVTVRDNGPGIVPKQIPNIFGKLLYGSKFHSMKQSRGQQGIGISAAAMYGQLTTGKPMDVVSRTGPRKKAVSLQVMLDTNTNKPKTLKEKTVDWDLKHGTEIRIELEAEYLKGKRSVDEFIYQVAVANPPRHAALHQPARREVPLSAEYRSAARATQGDQAASTWCGAGGADEDDAGHQPADRELVSEQGFLASQSAAGFGNRQARRREAALETQDRRAQRSR